MRTTITMKNLFIISLLFFMVVSCKKNDVATIEKKQVVINLRGKQVKAEASMTQYLDGSSKYSVVSGGSNLAFIQISPMGIIRDFGGTEASFLSCMNAYSTNCNRSFFCSAFCRGSALLACGGGWVIGCLSGHTDPKL